LRGKNVELLEGKQLETTARGKGVGQRMELKKGKNPQGEVLSSEKRKLLVRRHKMKERLAKFRRDLL